MTAILKIFNHFRMQCIISLSYFSYSKGEAYQSESTVNYINFTSMSHTSVDLLKMLSKILHSSRCLVTIFKAFFVLLCHFSFTYI